MSAKTRKALKKYLRSIGIDPDDVRYMGSTIRVMEPACGRALYQRIKKNAAKKI